MMGWPWPKGHEVLTNVKIWADGNLKIRKGQTSALKGEKKLKMFADDGWCSERFGVTKTEPSGIFKEP